jgi:hypothetical protein
LRMDFLLKVLVDNYHSGGLKVDHCVIGRWCGISTIRNLVVVHVHKVIAIEINCIGMLLARQLPFESI